MQTEITALTKTKNLDAIVITAPSNLFYFTGYLNSDAVLILKHGKAIYLTDKRYCHEASRMIPGAIIKDIGRDMTAAVRAELSDVVTVGFESSISYAMFNDYFAGTSLSLSPVDDDLAKMRLIKTDAELEMISRAAKINDKMYEIIAGTIHEGMTERELSSEIEYTMRKLGADGIAFETIVAFGEGSSEPHHKCSDRALRNGDFITIDCGAKYHGYCSDITRTFCYGNVDSEQEKVYNHVLEANLLGIEKLTEGIAYRDVDKCVRDYLDSVGLLKYFTHGLGHGVGIDIHELPTLNPSGDIIAQKGHIVTIEPGVYIDGEFGVRIEDLLVIDASGASTLSHYPKKLIKL